MILQSSVLRDSKFTLFTQLELRDYHLEFLPVLIFNYLTRSSSEWLRIGERRVRRMRRLKENRETLELGYERKMNRKIVTDVDRLVKMFEKSEAPVVA